MGIPGSFKDLLLVGMRRAQNLFTKVHYDLIDPQFHIAMPKGD